jgi:hypothetical protein
MSNFGMLPQLAPYRHGRGEWGLDGHLCIVSERMDSTGRSPTTLSCCHSLLAAGLLLVGSASFCLEARCKHPRGVGNS